MDAFLYRWGWGLVAMNLLGWGMALAGLYGYLNAPLAGSPLRDPGMMMGLGVVLMMPQTVRLLVRYWVAEDRTAP